jgi:PAS domain S-box-containing protein
MLLALGGSSDAARMNNSDLGESFERVLESAPIAILVSDEDSKIVLANAEARRLLGYRRDELVGRHKDVLVPPSLREQYDEGRNRALHEGGSHPIGSAPDARLLRQDGSEIPVEAAFSIVETDRGKLVVTSVRDRAAELESERERESLESRLRRATGTEAINAQLGQAGRLETVGQLAGGIAHDFNNILGVIINYSQFVMDELDEDAPVRADIEEIWRAARRGAGLTRQLTIFSRHESQALEALDLNEVVSELEALLRRTIGEHITLVTELEEGVWPIEGDRGQIEQALVNLALNSRDAMREGGTLTVSTANVEFDEREAQLYPNVEPGRFVCLRVEDTGTGMDSEVAARAFEPFYTTKSQGEGTGLGLAIVYGIVTSSGGAVSLSSEPGLGTVVSAYFPSTSVQVPKPEEPPASVAAEANETVLVVEDDPSMRRMTERILARVGYEVVGSPSGKEALRQLEARGGDIDLLLTDVVMPEMSGTELASRAGALYPGLRILLMSGYVDRPGVGPLQDGAVLLEKPFRAEDLLEKVRLVLDADSRPRG